RKFPGLKGRRAKSMRRVIAQRGLPTPARSQRAAPTSQVGVVRRSSQLGESTLASPVVQWTTAASGTRVGSGVSAGTKPVGEAGGAPMAAPPAAALTLSATALFAPPFVSAR